jgi:sugar phosphate permease
MVTYLDRVCISKLAPDIMRDLGLTKVQMGWVFSAFALAYAAFEIPTAWWADRQGTRRVLTRIVVWWSSFTIATAGAFNYASLLALRFLFGVGEAGAWPGVARTFSRWIPRRERGTIQGIFFIGAHLAGGVTTCPWSDNSAAATSPSPSGPATTTTPAASAKSSPTTVISPTPKSRRSKRTSPNATAPATVRAGAKENDRCFLPGS